MVQAELVKKQLETAYPSQAVEIISMSSGGDLNLTQPLYLLGGKALWTKELEVSLLSSEIDAIVHSLKDVPTEFPPGCVLGPILEREDSSDALVVKSTLNYKSLASMPDGSIIGTSSVRRVAQLRKAYPKLKFADVRGNLGTRLAKLDHPSSTYTALILASAGLIRLGLKDRITSTIHSPDLIPSVDQGALALEYREGDSYVASIIEVLEDWKTGWTCRAERSMLAVIQGGCSIPLGCNSSIVEVPTTNITNSFKLEQSSTGIHANHSAYLTLTGTITSLSGTSSVIATKTKLVNSIAEAEALGSEIALELIKNGGREILEELGKHVKEVGEEGREIPFVGGNKIEMPSIGLIKGWVETEVVKSPIVDRSVFIDDETCKRPDGW